MTVNSQSGPKSPRPPEDLITTATSALRRLNFKTGRCTTKTNNKTQGQNVPKVIVMGSSTASETTINTSTDSSNTIVTTMTATDGDMTEDSMDMNDPLDYLNSEHALEDHKGARAILQPTAAPSTPPSASKQRTPPTAKYESRFTYEVNPPPSPSSSQSHRHRGLENTSKVDKLMEEQLTALKIEARRRNSYKIAQNDFDKIETIRDEDCPSPKQRRKKSTRRHHSPNKYKGDKFVYDEKHIAKYRMTPPLPDLRVDFFNETVDQCQDDSLFVPVSAEKRGSVCLNKCLREVGAQLDATATSPINVTTNPMDSSVHFAGSRKIPQATIVVQQPSLSVDHSNISTILLKNGSEFISNVESPSTKAYNLKKQREENMKQLLDVTNNLTLEEIHDFEMRYGSPHHNRSQSVKMPGRTSGRPNYLCLPQQRSRVASMPNTGVEEEYYRLRHFSITGKGVVNRGDSLKSRRSRSNNSVASSNSSTEQLPSAVSAGSARTSATCSLASSRESSTSVPGPSPYRVLMLGGPAVGKSSLVSQFMTSEYLHAYDTSIDDESGEKSVSVLLAGEESELVFIDFTTAELSPESCIRKYSEPHAFCVVYSSADRSSMECAENILQTLWTLDTISTKAVILVANKADLVRSRVVSTEEGKSMATSYDCKYIETSVGINHNVDELLVGILTQIRLKLENPERSRDLFRKRSSSKRNRKTASSGSATPTAGSAQNSPKKYRGSRTSASLKVKSLLGKVWARDSKSKSCENLHVL
ncbi:PREDICTED: uncharacterized protein LOC108557553 isoform X2 [Nicrophorus vespilloides]|uniref:Uncharacterized protein LOC108557553 isoform X2 n=1 Tax=Nicrophorus vespilloides TaxID=110193 RepID=A0ABM1M4U8_NICVS|nr:PREDICTED: uncharacterized protein LOC108557553 isoform X2 [Nicrophorus vespilloides]